jgi:hypothetical protein
MSDAAHTLLKAFEALSPAEQHEVAVEILRRTPAVADEEMLLQAADDLFQLYDAEEADRASGV